MCFCSAEWTALYTAQLTQKAKKYHDGVVRLVKAGPHVKQVRSIVHLMICCLFVSVHALDIGLCCLLIMSNVSLLKSSCNHFIRKGCDISVDWMFRLFCWMKMAKC